ncbi:hypothetical protein Q428_07545 [Fervidicella metallireducens AeB]|uniref:Major facilitator superfamily (MFS) profile domain-containing protein n=1 Tax=Fervidicella metallireducens AeB TaxID=1403537 RepID=A0A017RUU4_9CLOT|nr:MFS transporter [Fervidicella metallireducens]EYE88523.1 hypothetical protein Q428_07545 [Fervidicella metallireducens AeB]
MAETTNSNDNAYWDQSILDRNLKFYVLNGILYTIVTCLYKPFSVKYIYRLNGTDSHVSLFNALPGLIAVFATIPGILLMNKAKNRKKVMSFFFLFSRIFILSFAFMPFIPKEYRPIVFVLLASFMNFPESVSTTALQSYCGDIFPEGEVPNAIASRNKFSTLANFVIMFILGVLLGIIGESEDAIMHTYQIFFVLSFIVGLIEIKTFNELEEVKHHDKEDIRILETLKEIVSNKKYTVFIICSLLFHFGWQMGWPLFNIYQIKYLGANETWLSIINITSGLVMFLSYNYWKNLIYKKGNSFVTAFATFGMALTPIIFALSPNLYTITVAGLITGFFTSGTVTVLLNLLLEVSPEKNRVVYIAIHVTLTNITLCISPLVGDQILKFSNIYIALYVTALFRFIGSMSFTIRNLLINRNSNEKCNLNL